MSLTVGVFCVSLTGCGDGNKAELPTKTVSDPGKSEVNKQVSAPPLNPDGP